VIVTHRVDPSRWCDAHKDAPLPREKGDGAQPGKTAPLEEG
jgi:hypothetical protein